MKKIKLNAELYVGNDKLATTSEVTALKNSIDDLQQVIVTDGEGDKFLSDDGSYKEVNTSGTGTVIQGPKGDKGADGKSAYQIAVDNGYVGTESDWLVTLKGDKGDTGEQGPQGIQGVQGPKGDKGDTGAQGPKGDKGDKGDNGAAGEQGPKGADGKSAYESAVSGGYGGTEEDFEQLLANLGQGGSYTLPVASDSVLGGVKVDGTSVTVDIDGTIHAQTDTNTIKQNVQDYMTEHPVSAEVGNKTVTEEKLSDDVLAAIKAKKVMYADTVADMKDLPLYDGAIVQTRGFHASKDGGGAHYRIWKKIETNNMLEFSNRIIYGRKKDIGTSGTIYVNEDGTLTVNGNPNGMDVVQRCFHKPIKLTSGTTYCFSITTVGENPGDKYSIQLEDGDQRKSVIVDNANHTKQYSVTFTTSKDTTITSMRFGFWTNFDANNMTVLPQLEVGSTPTPWKRANRSVNNHTVIEINENYVAELIVMNDTVNIKQMGYIANCKTQDCHSAIDEFISLTKRDNLSKYKLYIPEGIWLFSETDISNGRVGAIIHGVNAQVSTSAGNNFREGETVIMPFNNNQRYIWNLGESYTSKYIVGGYDIRNIVFSTGFGDELGYGSDILCETGLLLTYCCYSYFDGLYFHYFNGTGLAIQVGWENYFGFLNFRGVGYANQYKTYHAMEFRHHPLPPYSFPSAISATYFDYFNFEGITGCAIYADEGCNFVHCEINDIQAEFTHYGAHPSDVTYTYMTETKEWDDQSTDIEHIYLIKGNISGVNNNHLLINNISLSTGGECTRTLIWTGEDGYKHRRYQRWSGIFGELEYYYTSPLNRRDPICVDVKMLSSLPNMPIFHCATTPLAGTHVRVSTHQNNTSFPFKGNNVQLNNVKVKDWECAKQQDYDYEVFYPENLYKEYAEGKYLEGASNGKRYVYSHGGYRIPIDGRKTVKLRLYIDYTPETLPNRFTIGISVMSNYFNTLDLKTTFSKDSILSGKYPLQEWFEWEIPSALIPLTGCLLHVGPHRNTKLYIDTIKVSKRDKVMLYNDFYSKQMVFSPIYTEALCRNRKDEDMGMNSAYVIFDGTDWKTRSGKSLKTLPKSVFPITTKLTNCTLSNSLSEITADTSYTTEIVPTPGYVLDSVIVKEDGKDIIKLDGSVNELSDTQSITIPSAKGNYYIEASASIHHNVTKNITNCVSSNDIDFSIDGKTYTTYIYAEPGYTLDGDVTCTMGGVDVTVTMGNYNINKKTRYGGKIDITSVTGEVVITSNAVENEHKSVNLTLNHCLIDYNKDYVLKGSELTLTITPEDGYVLEPVDCKMVNGTGTDTISFTNGVATIWEVKGDITITAEASLIPPTA